MERTLPAAVDLVAEEERGAYAPAVSYQRRSIRQLSGGGGEGQVHRDVAPDRRAARAGVLVRGAHRVG
jgi:hypothetical protein